MGSRVTPGNLNLYSLLDFVCAGSVEGFQDVQEATSAVVEWSQVALSLLGLCRMLDYKLVLNVFLLSASKSL